MIGQLTIRGVDKALDRHLRALAKREGVSLSKAALMLMRNGAGLADVDVSKASIGNALDQFIGSWSERRERELLESIGPLRLWTRGCGRPCQLSAVSELTS